MLGTFHLLWCTIRMTGGQMNTNIQLTIIKLLKHKTYAYYWVKYKKYMHCVK